MSRLSAQTATLQADAAVTSVHPATNYGTLSNLYVSNSSTILLRFDLGTLASGMTSAQISRATLRMYVNRINTPGTITVSPINAAWNEGAVTQQTLPIIGNASEVFAATDEGQFVTVDITSLVQGWVSVPSSNFGLALTSSSTDAVFDSKENDTTAHHATLEIAAASGVQGPAGPQGPKGDTGAIGPAGAQGVAGPTGSQGQQGLQGLQGPKGDTGTVGPAGPQGQRGERGPAGDTGPQGAAGPAGATGSAGQQGATGPSGPQGSPGPIGLIWQGSYTFTGNYAANDAVAWQGQSWLSLHASNHGNTPDLSPSDWTLLAAQGTAGPPGIQGNAGPQGAAGPQGPKGDTGATGAIGPTGPPGMTFQGTYTGLANYAVNDTVTYAGGMWISLSPVNRGNLPDQSPGFWQQIAAPGAMGTAGAQGPAGNTGPQGLPGPTGPQGPPVHFQGTWSSATAYNTGDAVFYNGSTYVAIAAVSFSAPGASPAWILLAQQGATGPAGQQGATGATGADGAAGPQGPTGRPGLQWQGPYNRSAGYVVGDTVSFNGSSYISVVTPNIATTPGTDASWQLLAAAGTAGANGAAGAPGATGSNGASATIQIGSVTVASSGSSAAVQNVGTASAAVLNFTLPQGPAGAAGTPGLVFQGSWVRGAGYSLHDVVYRSGSSYVSQQGFNTVDPLVSVANNSGEWALLVAQGDAGPAGATGPTGATPTIAVHATFTGAPGTAATVSNIGTSTAMLLDFTIPQGAAGSGSGSVFTTVHTVAAASEGLQIHSPLIDLHAAIDTPAVEAYLPSTCNLRSVLVYNASNADIAFEIRSGTPAAMSITSAGICTAKANTETSCTGPGLLGASNFISFGITSNSAATSSLFTQFSCD